MDFRVWGFSFFEEPTKGALMIKDPVLWYPYGSLVVTTLKEPHSNIEARILCDPSGSLARAAWAHPQREKKLPWP